MQNSLTYYEGTSRLSCLSSPPAWRVHLPALLILHRVLFRKHRALFPKRVLFFPKKSAQIHLEAYIYFIHSGRLFWEKSPVFPRFPLCSCSNCDSLHVCRLFFQKERSQGMKMETLQSMFWPSIPILYRVLFWKYSANFGQTTLHNNETSISNLPGWGFMII